LLLDCHEWRIRQMRMGRNAPPWGDDPVAALSFLTADSRNAFDFDRAE
jgi:hypothetical protein